MSDENEIVEVCVDIVKDTGLAFLVTDGDVEKWIPYKWVENCDDLDEGDVAVDIHIPRWKAKDLELV